MTITLRPYQVEAADAAFASFARHERPAIVLPTGTGKTTVIAEIARRSGRTLTLAHRREIVDQIADRLRAHGAGQVGIEAGARASRPSDQHVAAMVQTLANAKRVARLGRFDTVIVDECHHATASSYQRVLAAVGSFDRVPTVGFTATLSRGDSARLGDTWDTIAYSKSIRWAVDEGYLCPVRGKTVVTDMDLSSVRKSGGDYQADQLGDVVAAEVDSIVRAWRRHGESRKTMAFVPNITAATELTDAFNGAGVAAEYVIGTMGLTDRQRVYDRFADGTTQVLVSVSVLTEGFDLPAVECVLMARPTTLAHVYVQAVGRGLRPSPSTGKRDCLVLDVVGVARIHSLTTITDLGTDAETETVTPDDDELPEDVAEAIADQPDDAPRRGVKWLEDIDLFSGSTRVWLRSKRNGIRFIPANDDAVLFLWPVGDLYQPGLIAPKGRARSDAGWLGSPMELPDAKYIAEEYAERVGNTLTGKTAAWRKDAAPSVKQINYARMHGISEPDTYTKSALSDEIAIVKASRLLDIT